MKSYRKKYEEECNIKIPKDYDIHHIDLNHKNNDIMNLVMLPKKLHNKYHSLLGQINNEYKLIKNLQSVIEKGNGINDYIVNEQHNNEKNFVKVWYECQKWVDYRNYLLGIMNNIHNIDIRG